MLIAPSPKFVRRRREIVPPPIAPVAPVALALVSATYDPNLLLLLMTFNQPVNASAAVPANFTVSDPVTHQQTYIGNGPFVAYGANGVQVHLLSQGGSLGTQVTLNVNAANGIVPASGGAALPAINFLVLPYTNP